MKLPIRTAFDREIASADAAEKAGNLQAAFAHMERAHIVGQRYFLIHMIAHLRMLSVATLRHDKREIRGQFLRLFAVVPGYLLGWVPKGNTGGANVSALKPMSIPGDIAPLLQDYHVWRDVVLRLAISVLLVGLYLAWETCCTI